MASFSAVLEGVQDGALFDGILTRTTRHEVFQCASDALQRAYAVGHFSNFVLGPLAHFAGSRASGQTEREQLLDLVEREAKVLSMLDEADTSVAPLG